MFLDPQNQNEGTKTSVWKTEFHTVVVLILLKTLLQNFHPQRQWCIKILLPWAQKFYTPLVLGWFFFSLQWRWCIKFCLRCSPRTRVQKPVFRKEHSMDQCRSRLKLSENFERHWSIRILGEIHMDHPLVHNFSWGNSYGPMVLKVLLQSPPTLVLVHGCLFSGVPQNEGTKNGVTVQKPE